MKKFLLALLTAVTAAAFFCGAAASVATYSASYDAPAGINAIVVQDNSAAVILQAADIDHIRADYTYTSSYAFESSKLYDFTVAGSTLTVTKTREPNSSLIIQSEDTRSCTLTLQVPRQTLANITVSTTNDSITLNGVSAQTASLTTDNGRIEVSNFNGSTLSGTTRNGKITMSGVTSQNVAATIQNRGTLIVALEGAWQPWSFHDADDTLVGYDVEVSRAIAEKLGVEPEYVESDWDSLFAGLDAGRYDLVCNGVEVTDERAKTYDFTTPYGYIHTALAVRKDNEDIKSFEDLKGKTTANSLASTYMELAESYGATVQGIDTLEETIQLLTAGRIDATLNADVSFYDYLNVHPDADFKLVAQTEDASHVAIPVLKSEDTTYLDALNTAIEELRADGTLKTLSEKYFGQDISSEN